MRLEFKLTVYKYMTRFELPGSKYMLKSEENNDMYPTCMILVTALLRDFYYKNPKMWQVYEYKRIL